MSFRKNGAQRFRLRGRLSGQKAGSCALWRPGERDCFFFSTIRPDARQPRGIIARRQILGFVDPFGRDGLSFPMNNTFARSFSPEMKAAVGGADELCLPPAMFLAEKNVLRPCRDQIDALERFVLRGLWGSGLQNPETYEIRRGLYWEAKTPSDAAYGGKWDERTSRTTTRAFNYTLLTCFFSAMHALPGVRYGARRGKIH
jgi:hypothetical protein